MSGKYYWVKTKYGQEIGCLRKSGQWELCGINVLRDVNPMIIEVLGEVSEWCADEPPDSNCIKPAVINQRELLIKFIDWSKKSGSGVEMLGTHAYLYKCSENFINSL